MIPPVTHPDETPRAAHRYDAALAAAIETRWQRAWHTEGVYRTPGPGDPGFDPRRPKFYCLDMFPYPSGAGLHVGHPEGYTATDIICRFKRMNGFNVLHPMGWDAFGLPAEQYAIQTGVHPAQTTRAAIENFRRQLQRFGFSYDWSREFGTIDEDYYRWTQWIFLKIYNAWYDAEHRTARHIDDLIGEFQRGVRTVRLNPAAAEYSAAGDMGQGADAGPWHALDQETRRAIVDSYRLAYLAEQTVNWCPKLGTALANEEVIDGRSERGGHPVFRKPLRQWMFRITAYADRLLEGLDTVDWPQSTRTQQTEWIGRSEGAEIDFPLLAADGAPTGESLRVFTTRPDTVFGATYMVVAPEHPLVTQALDNPPAAADERALRDYVAFARNRSDVERQESKEKTGVFTGVYAENPLTKQHIPVWTADYVLMGYGTGAIMAVPAQDERDWDFATKFNLPILRTVQPPPDHPDDRAYTGDGPAINSGFLNGLPVNDAKRRIIEHLRQHRLGARRVNFRLRDWLFSRQRYWGEPFPIVFDDKGNHHPVDESALPVTLPPMTDYQPVESDDPQPLLAKATDWLHTTAGDAGVSTLPPDAKVTREANTMPGWAGSCWYYLRYCDPKNASRFVGKDAENYWMLGGSALRADTALNESAPRGPALRPNTTSTNTLKAYTPGTLLHPAGFIPRDPYPPDTKGIAGDVMVTVRKLPHFTMPDATYFVTWRTADGITLTPSQRDAVLRTLLHFDGDRCRTFAACVMPDHVHWIVRPFAGHELADLIASVKRFAARDVNAASGGSGSVWQTEHLDHIIRDERWFSEFMAYVVKNPVEAGLASAPHGYGHTFVHQDALRGSRLEEASRAQDSRLGEAAHTEASRLGEPTHPEASHGVDLYVGGAEHAVLHLLYARFWHKVLYDLGEVSSPEPFAKLFHQGLILSHAYQRKDKSLVPVDEVVNRGSDDTPAYVETATGQPVTQIVAKMSKSLKNVVNPDDVIADYGADTFRLYEMYMGPLEQSKPWNTRDISGMFRFLQRAWRLCIDEQTGSPRLRDAADADIEKRLHRVVDKVAADIERLAFNTAIAAMIELVNAATKLAEKDGAGFTADQMDRFARVLAPFAPHMGEELWHRLGRLDQHGSIAHADWPTVDQTMLVDDEVEIVVQIQGKNKAKLMVPAAADAKALEALALADDTVKALIEGKTVRKVIAVPGRLVNIVAT